MKIFTTLAIICCMTAPWTALCHCWGDSLTNSIFLWFWPNGQQEPCNEAGSLSPVRWLKVFELKPDFTAMPEPTEPPLQNSKRLLDQNERCQALGQHHVENSKFMPEVKYFTILVCCVEVISKVWNKKSIPFF